MSYLDALSGIANIRVVYLHALANLMTVGLGQSAGFQALPDWGKIFDLLLRHSVPTFVLLSGCRYSLSQQNHPERSYNQYLRQRLRRLAVPYLIWTLFYYYSRPILLPSLVNFDPVFHGYPWPSFRKTIGILVGFHHPAYQFWFLGMLLFVNLAYPFARKMLKYYTIRIPLFLFLYLYLPSVLPIHYARMFQFFIFYDIGYCLCEFSKATSYQEILKGVTLLSLLGSVAGMYCKLMYPEHFFRSYVFEDIFRFFITLGLFGLFYFYYSDRWGRLLARLGRITWPIYILHDPILLFYIGIFFYTVLNLKEPYVVLITGTLTLAGCVSIYYVLSKARLGKILF